MSILSKSAVQRLRADERESAHGDRQMSLREVTPENWYAFVENHAESHPFHTRSWLELLVQEYGFQLHVFGLQDADGLIAAVPFMATRSSRRGQKLMSLPFTDCLQPLAKDQSSYLALAVALQKADFSDYSSVTAVTDKPFGQFAGPPACVRHEIILSRPWNEIVAGFPAPLQRNLRRASKSQLKFQRMTDVEAMMQFYDLHLQTRRKLGVPIQPKGFFLRLQKSMLAAGLGFVGVVKRNNTPAAAAVFLTYGHTIVYKYAASHPRALEHRPNDCLIFHAMQWALERGYTKFDFGISQHGQEGLRCFKRKWGASESAVYRLCVAGNADTCVNESTPLKIASVIIRNSPPLVCRALGEAFYRFRY